MKSIPIFITLSEYVRLNNMALGEKLTDVINSQLIIHDKSLLVNFPEIGAWWFCQCINNFFANQLILKSLLSTDWRRNLFYCQLKSHKNQLTFAYNSKEINITQNTRANIASSISIKNNFNNYFLFGKKFKCYWNLIPPVCM